MVSLGHGLGDDGRSMVSLEPEALRKAADVHHRARRLRRHLVGGSLPAPLRLPRRRGASPPARPHPHPRRDPADPAEPVAHGRPLEAGAGRPARARARAHRGDRPGPLGDHLAARAAGLRPRQPPAAAVGAAAHGPLPRTPRETCATTRSRSWTRWCPPSPPCTRTAAGSRPSASSPSPTSSRATCTPASTTWPGTRCGAATRTRPRFTTGTSAICRRCSGWPSGRRRAGSSRRPPTFPPCLSSSPPTPTHAS